MMRRAIHIDTRQPPGAAEDDAACVTIPRILTISDALRLLGYRVPVDAPWPHRVGMLPR